MKPMTREMAESWVVVLKQAAEAQPGKAIKYRVSERRLISCTYLPNLSYGRYNEPVHGNEAFQWVWAYWTQEDAGGDEHTHVAPESRGWRGCAHEGEALALLQGEDPTRDAGLELARRFA